jgi:predicted transcriptional regulator YheO
MASDFDFTSYMQLVDFLGHCFGENTEVVLHDFKDINHSIIKIHNGHISGRTIGDPLTSFAISKMKDKGKEGPPYYLDYLSMSKNGTPLRSNSFFILDRHGNPRGMLCINTDVTKYQQAAELLQKLAFLPSAKSTGLENRVNGGNNNGSSNIEALHLSARDVINEIIYDVTQSREISVERLTVDEKVEIVRRLNEEKFFLIKGAVSEAAAILNISVATVYRYLSKINKGK